MTEQPYLPIEFYEYPEINIGHTVRLYEDDGWFNEGKITIVANGYAHANINGMLQSWKINELFFEVIDFQLVLLPKAYERIDDNMSVMSLPVH